MERSVLFVAALGWEAETIAPLIDGKVVSHRGPFTLWKGRSGTAVHWLLRVGVGPERAAQGMRWAVDVVRPTVVASTGCAGALAKEIDVGDVVVAEAVVDGRGTARATSIEWREHYRRAAVAAGLVPYVGRILTSESILCDPASKRQAAETSGGLAVEMEAAAIAECCAAKGLEFCAARVILDGASTPLVPELTAIVNVDGRVSAPALLRVLARRPGLIRDLLRVGSAMRACRGALARLHRELIIVAR
jgi:adenosylhomocysteine nucleosidase